MSKLLVNLPMRIRSGFTLIELIIVVSLLGILTGVTLSVINPQHMKNQSADSVRVANLQKIVEAAETYNSLEGGYPTSLELQNSAYIANWPDGSPLTTDTYTYSQIGGGTGYSVQVPSSTGGYYAFESSEGFVKECNADGSSCTKLTGEDAGSDTGTYTACSTGTCSCSDETFTCPDGYDSSCTTVTEPCSGDTCAAGYKCCECVESAPPYTACSAGTCNCVEDDFSCGTGYEPSCTAVGDACSDSLTCTGGYECCECVESPVVACSSGTCYCRGDNVSCPSGFESSCTNVTESCNSSLSCGDGYKCCECIEQEVTVNPCLDGYQCLCTGQVPICSVGQTYECFSQSDPCSSSIAGTCSSTYSCCRCIDSCKKDGYMCSSSEECCSGYCSGTCQSVSSW